MALGLKLAYVSALVQCLLNIIIVAVAICLYYMGSKIKLSHSISDKITIELYSGCSGLVKCLLSSSAWRELS